MLRQSRLTKRLARTPFGRVAILAWLAISVFGFSNGIHEDDLACEQAAAHLIECCDNLSPSDFACDSAAGCNSDRLSFVDVGDSECIQDRPCSDLRARGFCDASKYQVPAESDDSTIDSDVLREPVCR